MFFDSYRWWIVTGLLALGALGLSSLYGTHTISLSQDLIQNRIDSQLDRDFPVQGAAAAFVKSLRPENVEAHIRDGRVEFLLNARGALRNDKEFGFSVFAIGAPRYDDGAFYFDPDKVELRELSFGDAGPGRLLGRVGEKAARLLTDRQEWASPLATALARRILAHKPVYRLKDDLKGALISASLQSVQANGDRIDVTFSVTQFAAAAIFGALSLLAALVVAAMSLFSRPTVQRATH